MLSVRGISKAFAGTRALQGVDLDVQPGEIVGLVGANGAGKSTLVRILDGLVQPDEGEIRVGGRAVRLATPREARSAGIGFVHQHSATFEALTVAQNILIEERQVVLLPRRMDARAREVLQTLGAGHIDPARRMVDLPAADRQIVDVARVLSQAPQVLLFDEPTSSLSEPEKRKLFEVVSGLRAAGRAVVFISHFLDDVLALADRVVVLRDGRVVMQAPRLGLDRAGLVHAMLGRALEETDSSRRTPAQASVRLNVVGLRAARFREPISFCLHDGEVVGLWGLVGAGRTELLRALIGLDPASAEAIELRGPKGIRRMQPAEMLEYAGYLTESRQTDGLFDIMSVWKNMTMASLRRFTRRLGMLSPKSEQRVAGDMVARLGIVAPSVAAAVSELSGGNQQKVLFARWLVRGPSVYLLDEPTHGVDIGSKAQIHQIIAELAASKAPLLVVSSEMEEILAISDRILVMREGRMAGELTRDQFSAEALLSLS